MYDSKKHHMSKSAGVLNIILAVIRVAGYHIPSMLQR